MESLSDSSFNKWRCLIALAHIDRKFQPTERQFFVDKIKVLEDEKVNPDQINTLYEDFDNPKKPDAFFLGVKEPFEKVDLLRLAYELFWVDGEFDDRERRAFHSMNIALAKDLNIDRFMLEDLAKLRADKDAIRDILSKLGVTD